MSNLTLNLTEAQNELMRSFFDGLTGAGGLSSADYTALADALEFGTLEEVSLTGTRYEVNLFGVGHVAQGSVIYSGSGFQTAGWDGNPLTLSDGTIDVSSIINSIEIRNPLGHEMFVLRGGLSGIEMLGSETTAGSFNLTELQLGSLAAGSLILFKGNLTAALTSPNLTLDGSISELSLYVRNGTDAYELKLSGNLTPSASLMEQVNGDITTLSSNLGGELNGLHFTCYTYADAVSQTPSGTQTILDASGLHLTAEDLEALMSAATHGLGPDVSFSQDGQTITDIGTTTDDRASFIALQSDGKLLVAGFTNQYGSDPQLNVVRYNSDGTLDSGFDGDGKFSTLFPSGSNGANWIGVGQQADGKINVVALRSSNDLVHLRLNADGSLDTGLDLDGISQISLGPLGLGMASHARSLADGKQLVSFSGGFKLAQFNTNGSLDTGFGGGDGITELPVFGNASRIQGLADGSILVAGTVDNQITLARFTAAGVLDTGFNNGSGYATVSIGSGSYANSIVVQTDGKILVGGGSNGDFAIARFNASGTLDTGFHASWDVSGRLTHDAGLALGMGPGWDNPYSLLIDVNGDILMTGIRYPSQSGQDPVYVVSRFGSDGWHKQTLTTDLGASDLPTNALLQSDGALLVGSTHSGDFAVTRLLPSQTAIDQILLAGDDTLTLNTDVDVVMHGYQGNDVITTGSGNDGLSGGAGDDTLNGGLGSDWASYKSASGAVTVSLVSGTASGAGGNDTLISIENLEGSNFADVLTGNDGDNYLRGNLGDDTLDGGPGTDWADYKNAAGAVAVSLITNTASGADGNDTLINIEFLRGSNFADSLTGNSNGNALRGGGGNDTLDGGAGVDWASYWDATGAVTVSLASNTSSGADGGDTLISIENITASHHADYLTGNSSGNTLRGNRGDDTLDGGSGFDYADYWYASSGVTANLAANTSSGADGNDTLINIEALAGSSFADHLIGNSFDNWLMGNKGDDTVDGGSGTDGASYYYAPGAVTVSLVSNTSSGADDSDTLIGIEKLSGSGFDDVLSGDAGNNWLWGNRGNDTLDGGNGVDGASYSNASGGVIVNLAMNAAHGADGSDTLISIELLNGSSFSDSLTGDAGNNSLWGMAGNDILNGGKGADYLDGGSGNDLYVVDHRFDQITEFADGGFDSVSAKVDHILADHVENLYLTGTVTLRGGGFVSRKTTTFDLSIDGTGNDSDNLLRGNRGHNELDGLGGNDTLLGGAGADILRGGSGADRLVGGAGADVFVFAAGDGGATLAEADMLYDFEDGIDLIGLAGGLSFADLTISQGNGTDTAAGNTVIGTNSGEYLAVLLNTSASTITALDFQLLGV